MKAKTISFDNGRVSFEVPAHWQEEHDDEGGVFYADRADSGTLRLDVATFEVEGEADDFAQGLLMEVAEVGEERIERLPSGRLLVRTQERIREEGQPMILHSWFLTGKLPHYLRLAVFSYSVPAAHESVAANRDELNWLERTIRAAKFLPRLADGERVAEAEE